MDSNTYLQELKDKLSDTNQTILIRSLDSVESVEIKENKITFNVTDEFSKDTIKENKKERQLIVIVLNRVRCVFWFSVIFFGSFLIIKFSLG